MSGMNVEIKRSDTSVGSSKDSGNFTSKVEKQKKIAYKIERTTVGLPDENNLHKIKVTMYNTEPTKAYMNIDIKIKLNNIKHLELQIANCN